MSPALAGGFFTTEKTTFALKEGNLRSLQHRLLEHVSLPPGGRFATDFSEGPVFEEGAVWQQWQKPGQGLPPGCS